MYVYFNAINILGIYIYIWVILLLIFELICRDLSKGLSVGTQTHPVLVRMRMKSGRSFPVGQEEEKGGHRNTKR